GQAFAVFLRSPHAFAKIKSIDARKGAAAPGILAVLTGADTQAAGFHNVTVHRPMTGRGGAKLFVPPRPPLATDRVLHVGQTVALAIAETAQAAQDAVDLIVVDYETLPPVTTAATAAHPGAPVLWPEVQDNVAYDWPGPPANNEENIR